MGYLDDRRRKQRTKDICSLIIIVAVLAAVIGAIAFWTIAPHNSKHTYTVTVTDKQVKRSDDSDTYMVYAKLDDGTVRVFKNEDSFIEGKHNSSDMYAELEVGKKYKIKVYGWRSQFWSRYENIIGIEASN